jgi:TP901 family phage tail tape measure protein
MAERRVSVKFSAEIQNFKSAVAEGAAATEKLKKASEGAGNAADQSGKQSGGAAKRSSEEITKLAAAHQGAATAAGFQYSAMGQLVDVNGKTLSSQQAAAHGLQTFSEEAYLAGQAAAVAGEAQEKVAREVSAAAEESAKVASEAAQEHEDALQGVGEAAIIGGGAVVAGVGLAVKAYADFDKQMSSVDAATHETAGNMALLRQAAIDAGADSAFSAGEAAQGIEELAKAGVSTSDILKGGLNGSLALAAAGSLGVGQAAEIAASALTQFKLSGDKVPHIADLLAAGAGKAQGSVEDLGAALNQSGLVASSTGLTIEETTGALAAFASAGLTGSDAGTSFKTMLMSLNPNSAAAATLMNELGIKAYDAEGSFIGMSEYAGVLQNALKGMGDEQRNATLKTLFGSDAVRAANVLYDQGAEGVSKWENAVNDAGYAADTAARMQNNLAGDLEKLGGSFDTVLIQSGSGANDVLRGMVQGLGGVIDAVGGVPTPVLVATTGVAALTGGVVLFGGVLTTVMPKIAAVRAQLALIGPVGTRAGAAMSRAGAFAAGAASAFLAVAAASILAKPALEQILKPTGETGDALEAFGGQAALGAVGADTLNKSFQDLVEGREGVGAFQGAIEGIADPGLWGNIDNIAVGTIKVLTLGMADVTSTSDTARNRMKSLGEQLASLDAGKAAKSFQDMAKATDGSDGQLKQLIDLMPAYRKSLEEQAKATGHATDDQTLLDIAMGKIPVSTDKAAASIAAAGEAADLAAEQSEEIEKALEEIGLAADGTVTDLVKFTDALINAGLLQLSARDAARGFEEAIDAMAESLKENGRTLDTTTEKGRANEAALDAISGAGYRSAQAMAANGDSQDALAGRLDTTFNKLVENARAFTDTDEEAQALARDIMKIPPGVDIKTWMSDEAKRMAEQTKGAIDAIPNRRDVLIAIREETHRIAYEQRVVDSGGNEPEGGGLYGSDRRATGGRVPGYTDGGKLPSAGPGTHITDGFLGVDAFGMPRVRVDAREWIINGDSSDRYNRELAAINAGTFPKMPGYANGGRNGREYSAQSLGYAPYMSSGSPAAKGATFGDVIITEQSDPVATWHEFARRAKNLSV